LADGIVTAPISKDAWRMAGAPYLDHTELLKKETHSGKVAMLLVAGKLRAALVTRHVPLSGVSALLCYEEIRDAAVLAEKALREDLGIRSPRLALLAFNPHGGEAGLLGREEEEILRPAADRLRKQGLKLDGPLPADAAWAAHRAGRFDAVVALYHDQALIPLKLAAGTSIVNWTLGLPFVRTSPGHGTAYDIAWRGKADPSGMIAAALLAARFASRRFGTISA
jgi:4-hydroxythreonine-4-phosphate dehydrogenase